MKSATLPSFWDKYKFLDKNIQNRARKAFQLWSQNPFHPSLHFESINAEENIWPVRITQKYHAIGIFEGDTVTWFWIGNHDDCEQFFA